jgi:hypothetical protein
VLLDREATDLARHSAVTILELEVMLVDLEEGSGEPRLRPLMPIQGLLMRTGRFKY